MTLGTPNFGAPIVEHIGNFCWFIGGTSGDLYYLIEALETWWSGNWIYDAIGEETFQWVADQFDNMCLNIVESSGVAGSGANQMELGGDYSTFLSDTMNSPAARALEAAHGGTEVRVVVTTDNYYESGAFRVASPDDGDAYGLFVQEIAGELESYGFEVEFDNDPDDYEAQNVADRLFALADDLFFVDEAWCEAVSADYYCVPNDEILPTGTQGFAGGPGNEIGITGPPHTREAQQGGTLLPGAFDALGLIRK